MADSVVSIILDTTDSSRQKRQKAITNVSAEATDGQLRSFEAVNALTLNDLDKITRVEKKDITTAEPTPDYRLIGADKIYMTYFTQGEPENQRQETYAVVDRNNKVVEASLSSSTIDPDTSIVDIDFDVSYMNYIWYMALTAKKNAAYEYEVVITATGPSFGTLKKTVKVIMYENVGDE